LLVAALEIHEPWPPLWLLEMMGPVLLLAWLFALGASVGSFLNVAVYRLPAGLSLVHPSSHCPRCLAPIRLRDNIPVFGWLLLRGRCRDCRLPISRRYPAVEFFVGCMFVGLAVAELYLTPPLKAAALAGAIRPPLDPREIPFWLAYAMHALLLTTLVGAALIESDGRRIPRRLFFPTLLVGFALPLLWPELRLLPALPGAELTDWRAAVVDGLAGLTFGALLGALAWASWWLGAARRAWPRFAPGVLLAATGTTVGWQQVGSAASLALLLCLIGQLYRVGRPLPGGRMPCFCGLFWAACAWTFVGQSSWGAAGGLEYIVTRSAADPATWLAATAFLTAIFAAGCGSCAVEQPRS
jgi:leader peptidase (prepilin peptidase)/N-methyltransferase